jgi:hypothetical protein
MASLRMAYVQCLLRLQRDNLGEQLWACLCIALFLIALTIYRLQ